MFNLVKYELRGYYKDFIIAISVIALINLLLFTRINVWQGGAIVAVSSMVSFAAMVVVFIWNIKVFSRDLYADSGYLLFTLPQSGYSILGSKLIAAILQSAIVGIVAMIFNYISIQNLGDLKLGFDYIFKNVNLGSVVFIIIAGIIEYIYFLITIYFSISLSKIAIKKKKVGKLGGFVIFVILSIVVGKITQLLTNIFTQSVNINMFTTQSQLSGYGQNVIPVNIAAAVFNAIVFILMFLATAYIIENKLDF